jgi:hypothetical protein
MPLPTIPSSDLVLQVALRAQAALTALVLAANIRTRRPSQWPAGVPVIVLDVIDEIELRPEANSCRVQASLFGAGSDASSEAAIKPIASVLRAVSRDCDGDYNGTDDVGNNWTGKIRNCSAPTRLPSPDTSGRARIIVDFEFQVTA